MESEWDLFRRGQQDQERHHRLIREAIKKNLGDIMTGEIADGGTVRIPIQEKRQYQFEFDPDGREDTASVPGEGSTGRPQKGDVVGRRQKRGQGGGSDPGGAGDGEGEGAYEVEISLDHVEDYLFQDLALPHIHRTVSTKAFREEFKMEGVRRKGSLSNLDKRRTVIENIKRNASKGDPKFGDLADDDLRFRTPEIKRIPEDQVAVIFIRDSSGSMGEHEKHLTRMLSFWIVRFLQHKYKKVVETAFILFDTAAREVSEEDYFHRSEGGGTKVSSGLTQARELIDERFPPANYNTYVFVFSDGDNLSSDNVRVIEAVKELLPLVNLIGYADIKSANAYIPGPSAVRKELDDMKNPYVITVGLLDNHDVPKAMKTWFAKGKEAAMA